MPKSHKMMLHTKRNMILININMLEVTGDTNPVRAGRYRKGEKKCNLSDTLITCMTFTSYTPHCCNATCVLTIWSVISILNSVLGMQFEMLSDAPAFTGGILPHTQTLDLTSTGRLLWLISAVLTPDLILSAVLCCRCHTCGLIRVVFFLFFFDNASVPILGGLPGSVQHECFLSWGQNGNDKAIAILSALPW